MAAPRTRKGARTERTQRLLDALELASYAQLKGGNVFETHVRMRGQMLVATNGHMSIGIPIEDDFGACVNSEELAKVLKGTGDTVVFTVVDKHKMNVRSGPLSVYVGCVADEWIPHQTPDEPCAVINNTLLDAMVTCVGALDEKADNPIFRGVWIDGYCVASSDRHSIFQVWHGIHLPQGLIIPKDTVKALADKKGELVKFGFTYDRSATFYFSDGTYIRTSLLEGRYPDYARVLDAPSNQSAIPHDFFKGLRAIMDFSVNDTIYFGQGFLSTHTADGKGARYELPGVSEGRIFNGSRLIALEKYAKTVDFYNDRGAIFMGEKMRGIVSRRSQ